MTSTTDLDTLAAALISLARSNIPPDVQELLLHGNPDRGIQPGALKRLIEQATGDVRSTAFHVISDIREKSGLGTKPMLSDLAGDIGGMRKELVGLREREQFLEARAEAAEAELQTTRELAATWAEKAKAGTPPVIVTDEMVDRAINTANRHLASVGEEIARWPDDYTEKERAAAMALYRAALEAVFAPREG